METVTPQQALQKAVDKFRTLSAFANVLGVRYQVVQQWFRNGVPAEYCPAIEKVTERLVTCEQLRPSVDWEYVRANGDRRRHTRRQAPGGRRATDTLPDSQP